MFTFFIHIAPLRNSSEWTAEARTVIEVGDSPSLTESEGEGDSQELLAICNGF